MLLDNAGKDATAPFLDVGHSKDAVQLRDSFLIGRIADSEERSALSSQLTAAAGVAAGFAVPVLVAVAAAVGAYLIYRRYRK